MKAIEQLEIIKVELERTALVLPSTLRALSNSLSIGEFLKIKFAADTVAAILAEEYDKKFPKRTGRIETRTLSESLR